MEIYLIVTDNMGILAFSSAEKANTYIKENNIVPVSKQATFLDEIRP